MHRTAMVQKGVIRAVRRESGSRHIAVVIDGVSLGIRIAL